MTGVAKINITESVEALKALLREQKTAAGQERVQALYLLKSHQVETVQQLAAVLGRNRVTVQRWLSQYRSGGLNQLLEIYQPQGRPMLIPEWAIAVLKEELLDPEGFASYGEVQVWLKAVLGIEVNYHVVHNLVRYKLKAKLKASRPRSIEQTPAAMEDFKKKLPQQLQSIVKAVTRSGIQLQKIRYWCQDETRLGLKTIAGRKLIAAGIKPIGIGQWERPNYYLYGVVEPQTGKSFFCEFSHRGKV